MKCYNLTILLILIPIASSGQIFVSNALGQQMFFGPKNVNGNLIYLNTILNGEVELAKDLLFETLDEREYAYTEIANQPKLKLRHKAALSKIITLIKAIEDDINLLDSLSNIWHQATRNIYIHSDIINEIHNGHCINIVTSHDIYSSDELEIVQLNEEYDASYEKVISVEVKPMQKWEKDEVWNLNDTHGIYYVDMAGNAYVNEQCPMGMEYNAQSNQCSKMIQYDKVKDTDKYYYLSNVFGEMIDVQSWEIVTCK